MKYYLLIFVLLLPSILMGQSDGTSGVMSQEQHSEIEKKGNGYTGMIKWDSEEEFVQVYCADTSAIIEEFCKECGRSPLYCYSNCIAVNDTSYFFVYLPTGFGESYTQIKVYLQSEDRWKMVAKGTLCDPWEVTAELDSCSNSFVFYTLRKVRNYKTRKLISVSKARKVGELSIDSLNHRL